MSIWDGFRNRLGSGEAKEKQALPPPASSSRGVRQDVEWNANLERKLKGVLHQLKVLTKIRKSHLPPPAAAPASRSGGPAPPHTGGDGATSTTVVASAQPQPPADPAVEAQGKRVGEAVKEVLPALALPSFSYSGSRGGGESGGLSAARRFFLDLWHLLMVNLEALEGKHQKHAYEAISYLITREEFDLTRMGLHHDQLRCSKDELLVIHRYRVLLFHTQAFINTKLSDVVERPHTPPYYLSQFCARVLAITFFRLPGVSRALIQSVALSTRQLSEIESFLVTLQRPTVSRLPIGDHRPASPTPSSPLSSSPQATSSPSSPPSSSSPLAAIGESGPSSPPVAPPSTARTVRGAVRIGRAGVAAKSEQNGTSTGGAGVTGNGMPIPSPLRSDPAHERRTDSPRIGARRPHDNFPRDEREGDGEEGEQEVQQEEGEDVRAQWSAAMNTGKVEDRGEDEEENEAKTKENEKDGKGNKSDHEGEGGYGEETGDGRSARKYTFTQDRCYWLVMQLDNTQRTKRKDTVTGGAPASGTLASSPAVTPGALQGRNALSSFPNLTTWNLFHAALLTRIPDNEDDRLRLTPTAWLKLLSERDRLYFIFLRDWVDHILYHTQGRPVEWNGVKGYIPFLLGFIYELRARKHFTKPLLDCTNAFLATDPSLLNLFVKLTFTRTKLYDAMAVSDTLSCLESWVEQFRLILSTEHHQLLLKILMFLYQCSEVFMGDARLALYNDFVLDRHFFYFFLHWDINVRNAFHQLLAYKMLRTKRSQLQGQGLRVKELASVSRNAINGAVGLSPTSRRAQQATSTLIDREHALDVMLLEKMEEKLKIAGNQMRGLVSDCYPSAWEVYVPVALTEYKRHMAQYYQWEGSDRKQPKMMPVAMVERTPPPVPILTEPRSRPSMDGPDM